MRPRRLKAAPLAATISHVGSYALSWRKSAVAFRPKHTWSVFRVLRPSLADAEPSPRNPTLDERMVDDARMHCRRIRNQALSDRAIRERWGAPGRTPVVPDDRQQSGARP